MVPWGLCAKHTTLDTWARSVATEDAAWRFWSLLLLRPRVHDTLESHDDARYDARDDARGDARDDARGDGDGGGRRVAVVAAVVVYLCFGTCLLPLPWACVGKVCQQLDNGTSAIKPKRDSSRETAQGSKLRPVPRLVLTLEDPPR